MSLDGYIARDDNSIGELFEWLQNCDVVDGIGALICGRTLFDAAVTRAPAVAGEANVAVAAGTTHLTFPAARPSPRSAVGHR